MKQFKLLFVLALALVVAAPAYAETQNVKVSGSLDAYWLYRNNFDLVDGNDAAAVAVGNTVPAQNHSGTVANRSDGEGYFMSLPAPELSDQVASRLSCVA